MYFFANAVISVLALGPVISSGSPVSKRLNATQDQLRMLTNSTAPLEALSILQKVAVSSLELNMQQSKSHKYECSLENAAVRHD